MKYGDTVMIVNCNFNDKIEAGDTGMFVCLDNEDYDDGCIIRFPEDKHEGEDLPPNEVMFHSCNIERIEGGESYYLKKGEPKFKVGDKVKSVGESVFFTGEIVRLDHLIHIKRDDGKAGSGLDGSYTVLLDDPELIPTIDPVTFKSGGKTYEPTVEFRVPSNADDGNDEWFYCPQVGLIMHNSAQEAYGNYGKNRIILREVEKKEKLLTKLVAGLTVKCNACDCDGVVGELYCTGIPGGTMWFHEGQSGANNPAFAVAVKMGDETVWGANIEGNITVVEEN